MKHLIPFLFVFVFNSCAQSDANRIYAEKELKLALKNEKQHNVINNKDLILKDEASAVKMAEIVLFNVYGEKSIKEQKPYEIHLINDYWVISGTLKEGYLGGTFLIIINAKNSEIIKITHGK